MTLNSQHPTRKITSTTTRTCLPVLIFCIGLLLGCGSSQDTFKLYDGTRVLPTTQSIPSPDSLHDVRLITRPDSVSITLQQSYSEITQEWSAQVQPTPLFRPSPFRTFTTLISKDLALASLARRERISMLSPDQARKRIEETLEDFDETIAFRVQLFVDSRRISMPLATLRQTVVATLRVDGKQIYEPVRTQQSSIQLLNRAGEGVYQYPITLYFERHTGRKDLLSEARRFELSVQPFSTTAELVFEWEREDPKI